MESATTTNMGLVPSPPGSRASKSSDESAHDYILHAHRQSHNSSKLPAFRFADLKRDMKRDSLVLPPLYQQQSQANHGLPSPISPGQDAGDSTTKNSGPRDQQNLVLDTTSTSTTTTAAAASTAQPKPAAVGKPVTNHHHHHHHSRSSSSVVPLPTNLQSAITTPTRNRASTLQSPSSSSQPLTRSANSKRPLSYPEGSPTATSKRPPAVSAKPPPQASGPKPTVAVTGSPAATGGAAAAAATSAAVAAAAGTSNRPRHRRTASSFSSNGMGTSPGSPPSLSTKRLQDADAAQTAQPTDSTTKEWAQGQRELLLPKTIESTKTDDRRKSRPPVSFRPPNIAGSAAGGRVPPIRSFRSSGSRKSLVLDLGSRRTSYESSDDAMDSNQRDRTLRALEGRTDDEFSQMTPPDSADATPDNENTADIFMRIAREDSTRRETDRNAPADDRNTISRVVRTTRQRPFSAAIPANQTMSPPQVTRRLSDQRENSRSRQYGDDQRAQQMTRELAYRSAVRDKPLPSVDAEDASRTQPRLSLRPSPITPRSLAFQDAPAEPSSAYSRRRPSLTDSNAGVPSRTPSYRSTTLAHGQGRTYQSSPLVPRSDAPKHESHEPAHGLEGTESSASTTAAPSTVWDELDDLKSRIHRLELTGKLPLTSGAAMSRASEERPPTATTNATTLSASPKRGSGASVGPADATSTTSSQREAQPILLSALAKTKGFLSAEAYHAVESAANEALSLSLMMGKPGQPGPISSGASTIGGDGSLTDRQLRRKAESICRSLTELCLALNEESNQGKPQQAVAATPQPEEAVTSPTTTRVGATASARRPSALNNDQTITKLNASPRAPTKLEERRIALLSSPVPPSPRYAGIPGTPIEAVAPAGRKSSLLVARSRRAATEEPEEPSGRKSSLLRTRRAGTEEPEEQPREGRKSSLLIRRRGTENEEMDESRFRAPSRAVTEVAGLRAAAGGYATQVLPSTESSPIGSSALPRRRMISTAATPRLVMPATPTTPSANMRRYLDRSGMERESNSVVEKLAEERGQRQLSLSQTAMLNRTGSINRRNRESSIPSLPAGGLASPYR